MSRKKKKQYQTQQTTPLCRPKVEEIAVAQVTDKYSEYPSNGLTPVKLAEIFREADSGDVRDRVGGADLVKVDLLDSLYGRGIPPRRSTDKRLQHPL